MGPSAPRTPVSYLQPVRSLDLPGPSSFIERSRLGAARSWLRICKAERGPQPCHPCAGLRYWSSPAKCAPDRWPHGPAARTRAWLCVVDFWRHLAAAMPRFKGAGGAWDACHTSQHARGAFSGGYDRRQDDQHQPPRMRAWLCAVGVWNRLMPPLSSFKDRDSASWWS